MAVKVIGVEEKEDWVGEGRGGRRDMCKGGGICTEPCG
jgi:hypothetical protein